MQVPPSWKVVAFTVNLILGLGLSQGIGFILDHHAYEVWAQIVQVLTMWMLSFIMINVGYEFTIDKANLPEYGWDYLIAMTAAGFPWIFVGLWFFLFIGTDMAFDEALLVARFAAPTSAGILFSMLEGAGLKETWLFSKARILAIFDDLDTIILMIPLKVMMVGFKWELVVVVCIMFVLLVLAWMELHNIRLPHGWHWTLVYAALVSAFCKILHHWTHHSVDMEPIHIEVLLPAFVIGCIIDTPGARHELQLQRSNSELKKSMRLQSTTSGEVKEVKDVNEAKESKEGKPGKEVNEGTSTRGWVDDVLERASSKESSCDLKRRASKGSAASKHSRNSRNSNTSKKSITTVISEALPPGWVIDNDVLVCTEDVPTVNDMAVATLIMEQAKQRPELLVQVVELEPEETDNDALRAAARADGREAHALEDDEHGESPIEHLVQTTVSLVFMVLVGLSMPLLVGPNAEDSGSDMSVIALIGHVVVVSILMILGKMFPIFCFRDEADLKTRLALCLGMCPRGEVGASIIVIALELDIRGPAVLVAMGSLAVNLVLSGAFIAAVKSLLRSSAECQAAAALKDKPTEGDVECLH